MLRANVRAILIAGLVLLPTMLAAQNPWQGFVAKPDSVRYDDLARAVRAAPRCRAGASPSEELSLQVFREVEGGNVWAFRAALLVASCFDGAVSEDFIKAGGLFFDHNASLFFDAARQSNLPYGEVEDMLVVTPESAVDNLPLQTSIVRRRLAIVEARYAYGTSDLVSALKQQLAILERAARPPD